jgi:hypothetical protein
VRWTAILATVISISGYALAQSGVAQLGLTEDAARQQINWLMGFYASQSLTVMEGHTLGDSAAGKAGREAVRVYAKLPAASRGPATSALYAWARRYVASPAFKAEYEQMRQRRKPEARTYEMTVDEEVKAKVAEQEQMFEMLLKMGQPKAKVDAMRKEAAASASPAILRKQFEGERAARKAEDDLMMKNWETTTPADPNAVIARILRRFIETTADVDFAAKGKLTQGVAFDYVDFDNDAYEKKAWQWQLAWELGPEVTGAARAAASEWLKTLGK